MYSPNIDKWYSKNGTISIDENGVWTYHDWEGNSVSYPDGYPDFKSAGMVIQEVLTKYHERFRHRGGMSKIKE